MESDTGKAPGVQQEPHWEILEEPKDFPQLSKAKPQQICFSSPVAAPCIPLGCHYR